MLGTVAARDALLDLVARLPRARIAHDICEALRAGIPSYARLSPELAEREVLDTATHTLRLWTKWLVAGEITGAEDLDRVSAAVRARAMDGIPLEDLLEAYRTGGRIGWRAMRLQAPPDAHDALLEGAELLMRFLDELSSFIVTAYMDARDGAASEEERRVRELLGQVVSGAAPGAAERALAARLGVALPDPAVPFAIALAGDGSQAHARLAARLRRSLHVLAVTQGERVVGLAPRAPALAELHAPGALLALGEPVPRAELADAQEEVQLLADHGRATGLTGVVHAREHLPALLLARSPRQAQALRDRYLAALDRPQHAELRRTLDVLLRCRLDRGRTCALLHVHRNTLAYRLSRVEALVGIDLSAPADLAALVLALTADARLRPGAA